jgi:hypothetical protein
VTDFSSLLSTSSLPLEARHVPDLAAVDDSIGKATNWNPRPDARWTLYPSGSMLFVGGKFRTIGRLPTARMAEMSFPPPPTPPAPTLALVLVRADLWGSGAYFYRLEAAGRSGTRKMIVAE